MEGTDSIGGVSTRQRGDESGPVIVDDSAQLRCGPFLAEPTAAESGGAAGTDTRPLRTAL